ncbi:ATP-binding protein [Spirillospora albida]|uniref:ATP-binding protein n=1 Tax=Spirillospora albida TaxID=58123 RepID=UPI0006917B1D|nr:ATP-binding protein [Spirillospora albida]
MSGENHTIELSTQAPGSRAPGHGTSTTVPDSLVPDSMTTAAAPPAVATLVPEPLVATASGSAGVLLGEVNLPAATSSVPHARGFSRTVITASGIAHVRDDVEVLVSELVTNAVQHATVAGAVLRLRLLRVGHRLRVEVHDPSPAVPHPRRIDLLEETGRGWFLVAVIAEHHGTEHTASGKSVWCELRAWPPDRQPAY